MRRTRISIAALGIAALVSVVVSGQTNSKSAFHDYRVVTVVDGLIQPWSIAFLPGGDTLITERPGRLRIVRQGKLLPQAVEGIPKVFHSGQGGLLEVMPHPNFASNRLLYVSYSKPGATDSDSRTALIRGRFENDRLTQVQEIFDAVSKGRGHYSGKIAFDKNGHLFLSLGDRQVPPEGNLEAHPAQDLSNHHGKIVRLHDDGRVPADNPFVNRAGARPEIWSYGHRNVQGLAIHPETGDLWADEHGPQGGDELNLIQPGKNYGWPVIGYGVNYTDRPRHSQRHTPARDGAADSRMGPVDRHFGSDDLHRRSIPAVARKSIHRRHGRSAALAADVEWTARHQRRNARAAAWPHPRHPSGTGWLHLPRDRRSRRQADASSSSGAG